MERIVLAYSGGLESSVAIPWLADNFDAEIVAVTMDLGHRSDLVDIRERALALGAVRCHVIDAREDFARDYVLRALQAGALCEDRCPMATALGTALIAKKLVEVARMEGAAAIAHGCDSNGNDRVRLEVSARALEPSLTVIAPTQTWGMSRAATIEYARARNIPVPTSAESPYSTDTNLWGRSIECGRLEDFWSEPPANIYMLTRPPQDCPDQPAYLEIEFEAGIPIRANGIEMPFLEMIESLETIAGAHGVGRIDMVENRLVGTKSREISEAPAAVVLHTAHRELERLVIARDLERVTHELGRTYADLVDNGLWFSQMREALDAFVAATQPRVTGSIRLRLFKGECRVVGRTSAFALHDLAPTGDAADQFVHAAADGSSKAHSVSR